MMQRQPDTRLTIKGVEVDVWISCYSFRSFGRERPEFHLTVTLTFPDGDWERIVKPEWRYRGDFFYRYKTHVSVQLRMGPLMAGRKRLPTNWDVTFDAFKYVDGSGVVCNKTYPDKCRFVQKRALVDAVVQMFRDDPGLYRRLVAQDFDSKIAHQRDEVAEAERRVRRERDKLAEIIAYADRFRPKDVPKPDEEGSEG